MPYYNNFNGRKPTPTKAPTSSRSIKPRVSVTGSDEVVVLGVTAGKSKKDSTSKQLFINSPSSNSSGSNNGNDKKAPAMVVNSSLNTARMDAMASGDGFVYAKSGNPVLKMVRRSGKYGIIK